VSGRAPRPLAALVLLLVAAGLAGCGAKARPGTPPRHALLITVAGLRADRVGAWGYPRPTTSAAPTAAEGGPDFSIDGLAASGVAFAHAFAPSADERVALASLLTGARAASASAAPALAADLAAAGFRTAAFVTGAAAEDEELVRGFAHVVRAPSDGEEDPDYAAARAATTWLRAEGEPSGEPLFVWLHLSGPAAPWDPRPLGGEDLRARFVDPDHAGDVDGTAASLAALRDPATPLDGLALTHLANLYDAEVARAARLVEQVAVCFAGRFGLLPRDLLAETVVVLAGVRGVELFQHGRTAEDPASLYDASLHVPLLLRHPPSLTGRRVLADLVELRDVAPTLREWLGLERDAAGSLLERTDAPVGRPSTERPIVLPREGGGSVRTASRHLVVQGGERRLFDPRRDPLERIDLAAEEPEVVRELEALLSAER
jgi:hypothetical protein